MKKIKNLKDGSFFRIQSRIDAVVYRLDCIRGNKATITSMSSGKTFIKQSKIKVYESIN